jgi:hypothetical protein
MLTMSRSKKGVWVLFTRTAMREGWGSSSSGVFCINDRSVTAVERIEGFLLPSRTPLAAPLR